MDDQQRNEARAAWFKLERIRAEFTAGTVDRNYYVGWTNRLEQQMAQLGVTESDIAAWKQEQVTSSAATEATK